MRNIQDTTDLQSPLEIKVEWSRSTSEPPLTLSISALMLNKDDVIDKIEDFIFYGSKDDGRNIVSSDSAVTCDMLDFEKGFGTESSYKMNIDLNHLKKDVDHILLVVSINLKTPQTEDVSFDIFSKVDFCLKDNKGFRYTTELNKDASPECKCIEVCLVKRYGKSWRFEEEKINRLGGLELSYEEYGEHLLKDNPFEKIGDVTQIELKFKERCKKKAKGNTKTILERSSELIAKIANKVKIPIDGPDPKPKGKEGQEGKRKFPKVKKRNDSHSVAPLEKGPVIVDDFPKNKRKFPKVKRNNPASVALPETESVKTEELSPNKRKRKFPKVHKHS